MLTVNPSDSNAVNGNDVEFVSSKYVLLDVLNLSTPTIVRFNTSVEFASQPYCGCTPFHGDWSRGAEKVLVYRVQFGATQAPLSTGRSVQAPPFWHGEMLQDIGGGVCAAARTRSVKNAAHRRRKSMVFE